MRKRNIKFYRLYQRFMLGLLFSALSACVEGGGQDAPAADEVQIEAKLPGASGQSYALYQIRYNRPLRQTRVLLDSGQLAQDGKLSITAKLPEDIIAELVLDQRAFPLILSPGQRYALGKGNNTDELSWAGAPSADALRQVSRSWEDRYAELVELGTAYDHALQSGNSRAMDSLNSLRETKSRAYWSSIRSVADTTSIPLIGYFALESLDWPSNFEAIRSFSNRMIAVVPGSSYASDLQNRIVQWESKLAEEIANGSRFGQEAPELLGTTPQGKSVKLSDLRGQWVLVDFWASWCAPCRRENPNLVEQYQRYSSRGFTVFSVSLDRERAAWIKAIEDDKLPWPFHIVEPDFGGPMSSAYGVSAIPAGFLIDPQGLIAAEGRALRGENLVRRLELELGP